MLVLKDRAGTIGLRKRFERHEDVFKVKESILANLKTNVQIISRSPEETAYVMNLDFYSLVE